MHLKTLLQKTGVGVFREDLNVQHKRKSNELIETSHK